MFISFRRTALSVLALGVVAAMSFAAPIQPPANETIKDRTSFLPRQKHQPLPATVVGVLVSDVAPMMNQEGRSGPPNAMAFSAGGSSYRWTYVPVAENPLIRNLTIPVGDGKTKKTYPSLSMASAETVKQWNIDVPYSLVEVQVNDGLGSPAQEGFVATNMRRLDGTKDFPAKLADVIADVRKRHQDHLKDQQKTLDAAFADAQQKALKDRKPTGPRETSELFYITYLPETERLRLHFRTTIKDGAWQFAEFGGPRPGPFPLPPPPMKEAGPAVRPALPPPPPPFPAKIRYGTEFGIEYGIAYEVSKSGRVERILILPPEMFTREIPPPPMRGRPNVPPAERN